jgi:pantothenate kinase
MISEEIRKEFASGVLISDVNAYVDTHKEKYEEWLKKRKEKLLKNNQKSKEIPKSERSKSNEDNEICRT